jgi:hypothetical protein
MPNQPSRGDHHAGWGAGGRLRLPGLREEGLYPTDLVPGWIVPEGGWAALGLALDPGTPGVSPLYRGNPGPEAGAKH